MKNKKKIAICVLFVFGLIALSSFTSVNSVDNSEPGPSLSKDPGNTISSEPIPPPDRDPGNGGSPQDPLPGDEHKP